MDIQESLEKISQDLSFTAGELRLLYGRVDPLKLILIEMALEKAIDLQKFIDRIKEGV